MVLSFSGGTRKQEHDRQLALLLMLESKVRRKMFNALMEVTRLVSDDQYYELGRIRTQYLLENIFEMDGILRKHYQTTIYSFALNNLRNLNKKQRRKLPNRFDMRVSEFIQTQALQQAQLIGDTTQEDLRGIIDQAISKGLGISETAKAIREQGEVFARARAETIAITETHNAAMFGNFYSAKDLSDEYEIKTRKEWISTFDARTREEHAAANGQVVDMDEAFIVGGERMMYPGDPAASAANVIRCRCVLGYVVSEE